MLSIIQFTHQRCWAFNLVWMSCGIILFSQLHNIWSCKEKEPCEIAGHAKQVLRSCFYIAFSHWCYSSNFVSAFKMVNLALIMITAYANKRINYEVHASYWCKHLFSIRNVPGNNSQTMLFTFQIEHCTLPDFRYNYFT